MRRVLIAASSIQTADVYSNGLSESIIAKAISKYNIPRSKLVLLSKCYFGVGEDEAQPRIQTMTRNDGELVNQVGLSRKHIFDAVEASVKRLGTYIDVLQIHRLDRATSGKEIMRALNDIIDRGWVRYIGASSMVSNAGRNQYLRLFPLHACILRHLLTYTLHCRRPAGNSRSKITPNSSVPLQSSSDRKRSLQWIARIHGWHEFVSMQNYHNLLYREEEREMLPYCASTGVGLIPWSPVARGALCRPWNSRNTKREETDDFLEEYIREGETDVDKQIVDRVEGVAKKHGVSMTCIATAWSIYKGCCPIIGLNSKGRVEEAVFNANFQLSEEDAKYLEEPYMPRPIQGY